MNTLLTFALALVTLATVEWILLRLLGYRLVSRYWMEEKEMEWYDQIHEELEQTYADDLIDLEAEYEAEIERLKAQG